MNQRIDKDTELAIDALRGIAALMVLLTHAFEFGAARVFGWDPAETPEVWRFARASLGNGDFWVWCFFAISGLCIHRSIARSIAKGSFRWWSYALARVTRIYPLFLLGLGLAICAWSLGLEFGSDTVRPAPWTQLAATIVNLQMLTTPFPNFGPSWSLTCEIVYYAAWPAALLMCGGRVRGAVALTLGGSILIAAGIVVMWRVFHRLEGRAAVDGVYTICVLFPVWIAGAWLGARLGEMKVSRSLWWTGILAALLALVLEWILRFKHYPVWGRHFMSWAATPGLILMLAGAGHLRLASRTWALPLCRWLGQFSYPCYILHIPLLMLFGFAVQKALPGFAQQHPVARTVLETTLTLGCLIFTGPRLERFFMNWRSAVLKKA